MENMVTLSICSKSSTKDDDIPIILDIFQPSSVVIYSNLLIVIPNLQGSLGNPPEG